MDRHQQLFMRDCLIQIYWEWRDAEDTFGTTIKSSRWELLESCIARINCEVFRGL